MKFYLSILVSNLLLANIAQAVPLHAKQPTPKKDSLYTPFASTNINIGGNRVLIWNKHHEEGSLTQSGGTLTAIITNSQIDGGFLGNKNSQNTITLTNSQILNGIKQDTGSLTLKATKSIIKGQFFGENSNNTLEIVGGRFGDGDIVQRGGSLHMTLTAVSGVRSFLGTGMTNQPSSNNVIHLKQTEFYGATQYGGSLELTTDSKVKGAIKGLNGSKTTITITNTEVTGEIVQHTGETKLSLSNVKLLSSQGISIHNAKADLNLTQSQLPKIDLSQSTVNATFKNTTLTETLTQAGGESTLSFKDSKFQTIQLSNNAKATLNLTNTQIKTLTQNQGEVSINLTDTTLKALDVKTTDSSATAPNATKDQKVEFNLSNGTTHLTLKNSTIQANLQSQDHTTNLSLNQSSFQGNLSISGGTLNLTASDHSTFEGSINPIKDSKQTQTLNVNLNQSQWKLLESSQISQLTLSNNAEVNFVPDFTTLGQTHTQKTLQADQLQGNGTFTLYADIAKKETDTTIFNNASGRHTISVFYNPETLTQSSMQSITSADQMIVAKTGKDSNVEFIGGASDLGVGTYQTNLTKLTNDKETQWVISSIQAKTDGTPARALTTALNTPYRITALLSQSLYQRLGDLRDYPKNYGLHLRYLAGQNTLASSSNTLQTKDSYMDFSFGFDGNITARNLTMFFGVGFDVLLFNSKNSAYTNKTLAFSPSLYWTGTLPNRFYYDVLLRYIYAEGDFDLSSSNLKTKLPLSSHSVMLSAELGWKIKFGKQASFFFMEPQSKLDVGAVLGSEVNLKDIYNQNIHAKTEIQTPLLSKSSLLFGYEYNLKELKGDIKLGPFLTYSLQSGANTILQDPRIKLTKTFKDDLDVGINVSSSLLVEDHLRFYFEFDSSFLGQYKQDFLANVGIRYSFGKRKTPPLKKTKTR